MRPSSTSFITLVVVATTLVSEARSKMVSSVIGSADRPDRAPAERLVIDDRVAAADEDDGAGQLVARDGGFDDRRNRREAGARFDRRRGRLRRQSGHGNEGRHRGARRRECFTEFNIY